MGIPLRVLLIEDSVDDVFLLMQELRRGGYEPEYEQIETAEAMRQALHAKPWDIVLSDYRLPQFDGMAALQIHKEIGLDLPFILISGAVGEERAVEFMQAGVRDCIIKGNWARLIPAIQRELSAAENRRTHKLTEEALRESQRLLEKTFAGLQEAVFIVDAERARILDCNPAASEIFGYAREEMLGRAIDFLHVDQAALAEFRSHLFQAVQDHGVLDQFEFRMKRKNGAIFPTEHSTSPLEDEQGRRIAWVSVVRDITERKGGEEKLRRERDLISRIMETSPSSIVMVNRQGEITFANNSAERALGLKKDQITQRTYNAPEWRITAYDGSPFPDEQLPFVQVMETGQPVYAVRHAIEWPDGKRVLLLINGAPLLNAENQVDGVVFTIEDVTESVRAQERLRQESAFRQSVIKNASEGLCVCHNIPDYPYVNFTVWNDRMTNITGYTMEEINRLGWYQTLYPDPAIREKAIARMARMRVGDDIDHEEWIITSATGQPRNVLISTAIIHVEKEQTHVLAVIQDITDRKRAEEELYHSNQMLRLILNHIPQRIFWKDRDFHYLGCNLPFAQDAGLEQPDEIVGKVDNELSWRETAELYRADDRWVMETDTPKLNYEEPQSRPEGTQLWLRTSKIPLHGRDDKVFGVLGTYEDITERKRFEEMLKRRATQMALLNDISGKIAALMDMDSALKRATSLVQESFDYHHVGIFLVDRQCEEVVMKTRAGKFVNLFPDDHRLKLGLGMVGYVGKQGITLLSNDVRLEPSYINLYPDLVPTASELSVPIRIGEEIVGVLDVQSPQTNAFNDDDIVMMETLADQLAVAIDNARLYEAVKKEEEEIRHRLADLEAVNRISAALRSAGTLDQMLPVLLAETLAVTVTNSGTIWLYDAASERLLQAVARGWFADIAEAPIEPGEGIAGRVFVTGEAYLSREFASDPHCRELERPRIPPGWGGACVPIRAAHAVVGVFFVSVQLPRQFSQVDVSLLIALAEMAGNFIHRMRLHEQTEERLRYLLALHAVDLAITSSLDLQVTLNVLLDQVTTQLRVDAADVLLWRPHTQTLDYAVGRGFRTQAVSRSRLWSGDGIASRIILERKPVQVPNLKEVGAGFSRARLLAGEGFIAYYGMPLIAKGRVKGLLEVFHRSRLDPDPTWLEFLNTLAGQAAIAIDNAGLFQDLQRSNLELSLAYDATIEGWSRALDLRDEETQGHTQRVTEMTVYLARVMGIGEKEIVHVRRGALLHDIGKMGIPDRILLKPGSLTEEEWVIMRKHPDYAYELLSPIDYLRPALDIPYYHHERWDGSGYPRALAGEQIPLAARVFTVVDVYDALSSDRPYRKRWSQEQVLEYIKNQNGTHFDPQVLKAFLDMIAMY